MVSARSKSRQQRTVPVSAQVIRLYADYLHHLGNDWLACQYRQAAEAIDAQALAAAAMASAR
jgi:hypothetical protein